MTNLNCFVINLPQDYQKKAHMTAVTKKNGITPVFIDGVYGADLTNSEILQCYSEQQTKKNIGRSLTRGEIGCALSHLSIYKKMLIEEIDFALILEDDIDFDFTCKKLQSLVKNLPLDWECVLLGHHSRFSREQEGIASFWGRKKVSEFHDIVRFVDITAGGYAYLLNQKGAHKWLQEYKTITKPIDCWVDNKINLYGISPTIVNISKEYKLGSLLDNERNREISESNYQQVKNKTRKIFSPIGLAPLMNMYFYCRNLCLKIKNLKSY